jgi:2-methylcitrate dehydratase PrpD
LHAFTVPRARVFTPVAKAESWGSTVITKALADFAAEVSWSSLPEPVQEVTTRALVDHFACVAGGAPTDWGRAGRRATLRWQEQGRASIFGEEATWTPPTAAFLHGHYGNMLDFDDTLRDLGHPGTCVIPATLAVAEQEDRSGEEVLSAIVAGYEVASRFGLGTRPTDASFRALYPTSWHGIGAAAAAARALGLNAAGIQAAIGIAAEIVPAAIPLTTDTTYAFKSGKLGTFAAVGVRAAYAAAEGLHGKDDALGEATPYWRAFGSDRYQVDVVLEGLGERYSSDELAFKPYPSCRFTHTSVEAARAVGDELGLTVDNALDLVRDVEVGTFTRALQLRDPHPQNAAMGPFCFPYVVTVALLGVPYTDWYAEGTRRHPAVTTIAERVSMTARAEFDAITEATGDLPTEVSATTTNGRTARERVLKAHGDPERPLSAQDVDAKFATFAEPSLGHERASALRSAIDTLATRSVRSLMSPIRATVRTASDGGIPA